jgi:hypothetical protein
MSVEKKYTKSMYSILSNKPVSKDFSGASYTLGLTSTGLGPGGKYPDYDESVVNENYMMIVNNYYTPKIYDLTNSTIKEIKYGSKIPTER